MTRQRTREQSSESRSRAPETSTDTQAEKTTNTCPECDGVVKEIDNERVCTDCQLVLTDQLIDHGPEWREFTAEDRGQKRRVGPKQTLRRHDSLSTSIDWRDKDATGSALSEKRKRVFNRLRKWDQRSKFSSGDRTLAGGLGEIQRMGSALNISKDVQETASALYRRAHDNELLTGRSIEAVAAASLYTATRMHNIPRRVDAIVTVSRLSDERRVWRAYKELQREFDLGIELIHPTEYVPQIVEELGIYDDELKHEARKTTQTIVQEALDNNKGTGGMSPIVLVASALYVAGGTLPIRLTQKIVADTAGVTEPSIRKHYPDLVEQCPSLSERTVNEIKTATTKHIETSQFNLSDLAREYCDECGTAVDSKAELDEHWERAHAQCKYCGEVFDTEQGLSIHKGQLHPDEKLREDHPGEYGCEHCPKAFETYKGLQQHIAVSHPSIKEQQRQQERQHGAHNCPYCDAGFSSERGLDIHKGFNHPEELAAEPDTPSPDESEGEYPCEYCHQAFESEKGRKIHVSIVHPEQAASNTPDPEEQYDFDCPFCDRAFETKRGRDIHVGTRHPVEKRETEQTGDHDCPHCDACFESERGLSTHIGKQHPKTQIPDDAVECPQCDGWFDTERAKNIHIAHAHSKDESNNQSVEHETNVAAPCPYCDAGFDTEKGRNIHIGQSHPGKPLPDETNGEFDCPACERAFDTERGVRIHLVKTHPDEFEAVKNKEERDALAEGEYDCPYCFRAYDSEHALYTHVGQEHPEDFEAFQLERDEEATTGEHECDYCPKAFDSKRGLRQHESYAHADEIDTVEETGEHGCPVCDRAFEGERGLSIHIGKQHPDWDDNETDKPYTCPHCGDGMTSETGLHVHIGHNHRDEKLGADELVFEDIRVCTVCDREFDSYNGLAKHIGLKHREGVITSVRAKRITTYADQLVTAANRSAEVTELVESYLEQRDVLPEPVTNIVAAAVLTRLASEQTASPITMSGLADTIPISTPRLHDIYNAFENDYTQSINNTSTTPQKKGASG